MGVIIDLIIGVVFLVFILSWFTRIARKHERIVLYTLGKYQGLRGPGWVFVVPILQTTRKVDTRKLTGEVGTLKAECTPHRLGEVYVADAYWDAISEDGVIHAGKDVEVVEVREKFLVLRPIDLVWTGNRKNGELEYLKLSSDT